LVRLLRERERSTIRGDLDAQYRHVLWNNDGLVDDAGTCQARFNAETSAWCRPSFVTLDGDNRYMSLFVADETGPWVARHNMTPAEVPDRVQHLDSEELFSDLRASGRQQRGVGPLCGAVRPDRGNRRQGVQRHRPSRQRRDRRGRSTDHARVSGDASCVARHRARD
jgi:hypothetical protein